MILRNPKNRENMREVLKYLPEEEDGTASSAEVDGVGFELLDSLTNLVDRCLRLLRITISS